MFSAILDHTHQENQNVRTFWFKPQKPISYVAGQFIEMYLPHDHADERGEKHWFTLSSSPTEALLSITTKYAGTTSSTFKQQLFGLDPGATIKFVEPMGDFVLPKDPTLPLVFVAGGIGVTPFRSMVKWLTDTKQKRTITAILAANSPMDILFEQLFRDYPATVTTLVTEPTPKWTGKAGRLSAKAVLEIIGDYDNKHIYTSGPEPMVETLEKDFQAAGVPKTQLISDFFPGYTADLR